ncbi:MAG: DNA cytosine methyltransferase [Planctomycetes bacterium]|nr:DNA cytosine methyltransferase [Planctomycetota bacterium]
MKKNSKPIVIDLFAGAGGLSLGLYKANWKGLFAIEANGMAFETLRHNLIGKKKHFSWPKWLPLKNHDINQVIRKYKKELKSLQGKIDLVVGGPPCQGFSMAGRRREEDKRNQLIHSYIEFVGIVKPKMIFFENVQGFTVHFRNGTKNNKPYSQIVIEKLKKLGYDVHGEIVDFSKFGVPQRRKRFIIIGTLNGKSDEFFKLIKSRRKAFLSQKGLRTKMNVKAAISDLEQKNGEMPCPDTTGFMSGMYSKPRTNYQKYLRKNVRRKIPNSHRFVNHREITRKMFSKLIKNVKANTKISEKDKKKYGVKKRSITLLGSNFLSPTLMSIPDDYIHYHEPRILTVREYARIQSFPDWYEFKGAYTTGGKRRAKEVPRYTQIGNAVPPLFAEHAGNILKELLD